MSVVTISYSPQSQGWTSFWSYDPDWMIGINNTFYTWKNGSLYEHDSNSRRNSFYGVDNDSVITTIFNQAPTENKMFKTISIDSNEAWTVEAVTDINIGEIDSTYFVEKEGTWFAFIRRDQNDLDLKQISTQGIGEISSYVNPTLTFSFNIGTNISQGDTVYKVTGGSLVQVGVVASHDATSITLVSEISAPLPGDFIVYSKDSVAESLGARGYYMETTLTNSSIDEVEIFEVATNTFKSFP